MEPSRESHLTVEAWQAAVRPQEDLLADVLGRAPITVQDTHGKAEDALLVLLDEHPETGEALRTELMRQLKYYSERGSGLEVKDTTSPEMREALESLGYVD